MRACAKLNVFLKITGKRDNYHELFSRFVLVPNLYDDIEFIPSDSGSFRIDGNFSCALEKNTVYKAYVLLRKRFGYVVEDFFQKHQVQINKRIPEGAGLGGGSSDAAAFLNLSNATLNLKLKKSELAQIGAQIGADVPFFVYGYESANVRGIGESVEPYDEHVPEFEVITPKIHCDTAKVYTAFREKYYAEFKDESSVKEMDSKDILSRYTIEEANDLYKAARDLYPELSAYEKEGWFFSGSGSSFFQMKGV